MNACSYLDHLRWIMLDLLGTHETTNFVHPCAIFSEAGNTLHAQS